MAEMADSSKVAASPENDNGEVEMDVDKRPGTVPAAWQPKMPPVSNLFEFADPEAIKAKVRNSLLKPDPYTVFNFYKEDGFWQRIAKHPLFENITLAVISANAVYIAVDTDWNKDKVLTPTDTNPLQEASWFFFTMEQLFCTYFSVELIVRFMAFSNKLNCFRDAWFVFDSILVILMVLETWILLIVMAIADSKEGSPLGGASILRLFRLLRLSRLMRMLRSLPELMILVKGIRKAMATVAYVGALLLIITYVFGIAFTQLCVDEDISDGSCPSGTFDSRGDCCLSGQTEPDLGDDGMMEQVCVDTLGQQFFSNVALSMYSLLIHATFLDDLAGFMNALRTQKWYLLILALLYIGLAALTVMNMLIGVLCEVVNAVAETERLELLTEKVSNTMGEVAKKLDTNFNMMISYEEFTKIVLMPEALKALEDVGVNPVGIVDFASLFFFEEGEPKELPFDKFMEMVLDLRDSNQATLKDLLNLWKQIKTSTNQSLHEMQFKIDTLSKKMDDKTDKIEGQISTILTEFRDISAPLVAAARIG